MNFNHPPTFFQNLGKLFYAISTADGTINENESTVVLELVHSLKKQNLYSDQIEITFNALAKSNSSSTTCFNEFVTFKNKNKSLFTPEINHFIIEIAGAIASSFSKRNKSELILLAKLELELKK